MAMVEQIGAKHLNHLTHKVMSSGIFCTDNPLAQSSSYQSRCWEEWEGSGRRQNEFAMTSDRGGGTGLCQKMDLSRGSVRRRHSGWTQGLGRGWGWGWGLKAGSSHHENLLACISAPLRFQGCY